MHLNAFPGVRYLENVCVAGVTTVTVVSNYIFLFRLIALIVIETKDARMQACQWSSPIRRARHRRRNCCELCGHGKSLSLCI